MMKKLLKKLSFVAILSLTFATVQAQTPVVQLSFDNSLTDSGSASLTFELIDTDSYGISVPYSSTEYIEGTHALNLDDLNVDPLVANYHLVNNSSVGHIQSASNLGVVGSAARTVSAWIRYDVSYGTTGQGAYCIVNLGDPTSGSQGRDTFVFDVSKARFQVAVGGGNVNTYYNDTVIEDGNWHHVAYTYASGAMVGDLVLYIDGVAVTSDGGNNATMASVPLNTVDDKVYIASKGGTASKWFAGGGIDDVRIYDSALTPTQMLAVYNENVLSIAGFAVGELKAYPNAVVDFLQIKTASKSALEINVFNISGKSIMRTSGNSVDMRALSSGLYLVKVREGNKVATLKILKK